MENDALYLGDSVKKTKSEEFSTIQEREYTDTAIKLYMPKIDLYVSSIDRIRDIIEQLKQYHDQQKDPCFLGFLRFATAISQHSPFIAKSLLTLNSYHTRSLNYIEVYFFEDIIAKQRKVHSTLSMACNEWLGRISKYNYSSHFKTLFSESRSILFECAIDSNIDSDTKQLNIQNDQMSFLLNFCSVDEIVDAIVQRVVSSKIDFPYKRYTMGNVLYLFENLKHKQWDASAISHEPFELPGIRFETGHFFNQQYQGPNDSQPRFFAFVSPESDYNNIDKITDYFQEAPRMRARRKDNQYSPMEWWQQPRNVANLLRKMIDRDRTKLIAYDIREEIYRSVGECTQFKSSLVKGVIEKLGAKRMLDFSAGWGDRLIGALGSPQLELYVATDPNLDLKKGHDEIINTLAPPEKRSCYRVIYEPFQTAQLPQNTTFDLVFTSPPYFDFEVYTNVGAQSIIDFPRYEDWLVRFLFVSLRKAWSVLEVGGHLIIHITDTRGSKCCEPMNLFIQSRLSGSVYEGVLASKGLSDKPRPMWAWRKEAQLEGQQAERAIKAEEFANKYFGRIWSLVNTYLN